MIIIIIIIIIVNIIIIIIIIMEGHLLGVSSTALKMAGALSSTFATWCLVQGLPRVVRAMLAQV